jgi:hypothetical protein
MAESHPHPQETTSFRGYLSFSANIGRQRRILASFAVLPQNIKRLKDKTNKRHRGSMVRWVKPAADV